MARPAEIAQIDVYDTHNRTLTYLSFEGPLAELIATRCIETIGRTITSCQLVASSDIGIRGLGFVRMAGADAAFPRILLQVGWSP